MTIEEELNEMESLLTANTEPPVDESTVDEDVKTDAPVTDRPQTDAPTTDAPESDIDRLTRENAEFKTRLDELSKPKPTAAPSTKPPEVELADLDFDEDDVDLYDPESFKAALNKVYKQGVKAAEARIKKENEALTNSIPGLVGTSVETINKMREVRDNFYGENKDLTSFKEVVKVVFEELASKNPNSTPEEILKDVGPETRKRLNLPKATKPADDNTKPPKLPRKAGQQRQQVEQPLTDDVTSQIDEMDKALNS